MKFIEMTAATLREFVAVDEITRREIESAGLADDAIVRVNQQGDIEVRRRDRWDLVGGLLGEFEPRVREATGLDWV